MILLMLFFAPPDYSNDIFPRSFDGNERTRTLPHRLSALCPRKLGDRVFEVCARDSCRFCKLSCFPLQR